MVDQAGIPDMGTFSTPNDVVLAHASAWNPDHTVSVPARLVVATDAARKGQFLLATSHLGKALHEAKALYIRAVSDGTSGSPTLNAAAAMFTGVLRAAEAFNVSQKPSMDAQNVSEDWQANLIDACHRAGNADLRIAGRACVEAARFFAQVGQVATARDYYSRGMIAARTLSNPTTIQTLGWECGMYHAGGVGCQAPGGPSAYRAIILPDVTVGPKPQRQL